MNFDVCIVGGGIAGTLVAEKLTEEYDVSVCVIEAGPESPALADRFRLRQRWLEYGENPFPHDVPDREIPGMLHQTNIMGGQATHWQGRTPRYSREDFQMKSIYGVGSDWPITYDDLEPFYSEAEWRIGVAGDETLQHEHRSRPFPMDAFPMTPGLQVVADWASKAGLDVGMSPFARNTRPYRERAACIRCDTCHICPTGAKYSPDLVLRQLIQESRITFLSDTQVDRLVTQTGSDRISRLHVTEMGSGRETEITAGTFVIAAGYGWAPALLLSSANPLHPDGLANSSGLLGKYVTGHPAFSGVFELNEDLFFGVHDNINLSSFDLMGPSADSTQAPLRFDLAFTVLNAHHPRLRDASGNIMLGDEILRDWREGHEHKGLVAVRGFLNTAPSKNSMLKVSPRRFWQRDTKFSIQQAFDTDTKSLQPKFDAVEQALYRRLSDAGATLVDTESVRLDEPGRSTEVLFHPSGGCRMGSDPKSSVCDSFGQTHDHANLFIVGAPTCVSSGCTNSTLTFAALALRSVSQIAEGHAKKSP